MTAHGLAANRKALRVGVNGLEFSTTEAPSHSFQVLVRRRASKRASFSFGHPTGKGPRMVTHQPPPWSALWRCGHAPNPPPLSNTSPRAWLSPWSGVAGALDMGNRLPLPKAKGVPSPPKVPFVNKGFPQRARPSYLSSIARSAHGLSDNWALFC